MAEMEFERNGITLTIANRFKKKLPVLSVRFDGDTTEYVIAFFKTNEEAKWFTEVFEEFLKGEEDELD